MTKELVAQLYSSEEEVKKTAIYRLLFDRRHDLLAELKKAASFEQNEEMAVFMVQVGLTLEAFPRDSSIERRIIEILHRDDGAGHLSADMWKYLENHGSSQMLIAALGSMGEAIPPDAQEFIEACLNHPDPDIRAMACAKAIKSGRPTHFAYVLNLITDLDPMVAETAFSVVREMPVNELSIILDYALGSPDEWVLNNVAPFLPLMINNGLRHVIAKVQYHKHPLVAKKAREALKVLDSIPYVSKRNKTDEGVAEDAAEDKEAPAVVTDGQDPVAPVEKQLSFKEQMELKRLQKMEEERRRKAEDEELAAELARVKPEDLASFADEIAGFDAVARGNDDEIRFEDDSPDDQSFTENTSFETESSLLQDIAADDPGFDATEKVEPVTAVSALPAEISTIAAPIMAENKINPQVAAQVMDFAAELPPTETVSLSTGEMDLTQDTTTSAPAQIRTAEAPSPVDIDLEDIQIQVVDETRVAKVAKTEAVAIRPPVAPPVSPVKAAVHAVAAKVHIPASAQEIISRYPSFISDPYAQLFQTTRHDVQLKTIGQVADNLIAFLNICFLQSCLFFAPQSDVLSKSIKECIKGHLTGPTSLRCLHNFALAMKKTRSNPVFFTFSLAGILSESSDANPLMMMRELKEFLRNPVTPLEENLPQAIEGLTEILRGVKSILGNNLVMKAPVGAKEPFADLSGPDARILAADKRPALDLPIGEVVLVSRDGTEALGLFPYFKYSKKKVVFAKPDEKEITVLLERLEIPQDQV